MLRVSDEMEKVGLDVSEHGGAAYEVQKTTENKVVDPTSEDSISKPHNSGNYNTFSEE